MAGWHVRIPITKRDLKEGLITGVAAVSRNNGRPVIDHDGEFIPIEEIERAVIKAMGATGGRAMVGLNHDEGRQGVGDVVGSWLFTNESRREFKKAGFDIGPEGQEFWAVVLKIHDPEVRKALAEGDLMELSLKGQARRVQMDEAA